jgi:superfamily II DNA or RNA helicase
MSDRQDLPEDFVALVRRNARSGTWSRGVTLSRDGQVVIESRDADEIVLRVRAPGRPVAPTVVLYPGEREWDCDCGSRISPCEHVAAAAIALGGGEAGGGDGRPADRPGPPPAAAVWGRLVYRFSRAGEGLRLERFIATAGEEKPLGGTLSGLLARPGLAGQVQPEQHDLKADLLLGTGARGVLPPSKLDALLQVLIDARDVYLDGVPVGLSDEQLLPRAVVRDLAGGPDGDIEVRLERDPRVVEVPSPGVGLTREGTLARLGEIEQSGAWLQHLPRVTRYRASQVGELTTRVLPELSRRMAVDVQSRRLPRVVRDLEPRIMLDLQHLGDGLSVLPTLVYGAPPCVRIDDGRMVYLQGPVPVRSEDAERREIHRLRAELDLLPGHRVKFEGRDVAAFASKLRRWRGALTGAAADVVGSSRLRLDPRLSLGAADARGGEAGQPGLRFDLRFAVVGEDGGPERFVDAAAVIRAWQERLDFVPLDGGGWAPLPLGWLARHGQQVADLLAAREADGQVANHALPALGALCADLDQPPPPGLDQLLPLIAGFDQLPVAALPGDLSATLRPYQQRGVDWLAFLRRAGLGGVLADDMGLGKTLQTLAVMRADQTTLVVCPTSVLPNWQKELGRFRPALKVTSYHGPGRQLPADAQVVLTTYAILRLDAERLQAGPGGPGARWDLVVLDEAQAIKNPDSQVARAAYALPARMRLCLTGTPIENRLDELWSLLHFSNRGLLGGRRSFDERFARPIADGVAGAAEELRRKIRPFVLRRKKQEVAPELPPRSEAVLPIALDERERAVYDAVRAATRAEVVALLDHSGGVMKALEALLRLRQAACHPALLPGQGGAAGAAPGSSSKLERLAEALELAAADGHKALVFSQWTSLLDLIEPRLRTAGLEFVRLDGSTRDRGEVVERFQAADGPPVMLISLKAGGVGLNLTAADHVFLCDPWWNPAAEAQAADRAHRIGQERPVFVYRLVAQGTVEERIVALQDRKRALFEAALGDAGAAASLTRDDLMELLA